jgi:uncharacterized protein
VNKAIKICILFFILSVLLSLPAFAANNYPTPTSEFFVNDFGNVLSQDSKNSISNLGKQLEDKTTAQVVLVTIDSLNGQDIDSYANELFTQWKIGQKEKDNGVLILIATQERKLRIEVGYGLEGALPDIKTAEIRTQYMNPFLKNNDYDTGLVNGYNAVVGEVAKEYNVTVDNWSVEQQQPKPQNKSVPSTNNWSKFMPILLVIFIILDGIFFRFRITSTIIKIVFWSSFFRGGRGGRGGGGGFGGGGFGGGGGGSSGGGGRSGGGGSSGGY